MYEYKDEIINSRVGCLGASDANIIANVAQNGTIPNTAKRRLAIVKGLIPSEDSVSTPAMKLGDEIEMTIFENLRQTDERWQSNFRIESKKFSKPNVALIAHIDFFMRDDEKKVIRLVECKATKGTTLATKDCYKNQLFVQYLLGLEYAASLGKRWRFELSLCHYCTANHMVFDPNNITMQKVHFRHSLFDVEKGMEIINKYLDILDSYYDDDEIDAETLPVSVKQQFDLMTTLVNEIEERKRQVEDFKTKIYDFFLEKGIKSVKSDLFSITLVEPTTTMTFDHKRYLADYEKKHPTKYRRILKEYSKKSERKGYVTIKTKNK